jgi:4-amino-4-deoxy-L-arabinose transferase-like glycosyltransferase
MFTVIRRHWPFACLAALALALVLTNLGSDYLWADEGDTAVLAVSIVRNGVPKAWDGVTFTDSDKGARVNRDLVMISHPWVQYYVTAASFLLLGENTFAARLPFALAG